MNKASGTISPKMPFSIKNFSIFLFIAVLSSLTSCLKTKEDNATGGSNPPPVQRVYNWEKIADSAQAGLNNYFWNAAGGYFTQEMSGNAFNHNYWPNAHALDVLNDAYIRKGKDPQIKKQMDDLLDGLKQANGGTYSNDYYDDMEWLLISTLRAYVTTGDARYKTVADGIWTEVKGGWDNVTGGGFYWRKDKINKNTPANAPACIFAARLYSVDHNNEDLQWAKNIYSWLSANLIQSNGDVWDGLNTNVTPVQKDNRLYSYNYGTVIGSALELYKATGETSYRDDALKVASAAISYFAKDGTLSAGDLGDGGLFNGIFIRYLTRLIVEGNISDAAKNNFTAFIKSNAQTLWQKGTRFPAVLFGPDWRTAPTTTTLNPQLSGVMLMESAAELKKLNLIN